ncbi:hypothetical protein CEUSTIGMA_g7977.t1 [Chlamydomonas eustigma]|uniref:UBC core domain-containing protein n=1 Tax=Chlamydomonas eustigma TaxID=1157962 RepID=A0A250XCC6_9CHLO|nr:hypothetical protein CEUSTIGMA_g7977.t1 [Chlamydomonas eustigma]|eukprot:GAX80539.1 hypothetical protein CEUSTIGMA_g7977.t1 [Chlamydomonas eustigma]
MSTQALARLGQDRKDWRKFRPFGFSAKPCINTDGAVDLLNWTCTVPGKEATAWEGGKYPLKLAFSAQYPSRAPSASFPAGFLHPNVYPDGHVCLSILNDDEDLGGTWAPSISVKQILLSIQQLLDEPNLQSPAQHLAEEMLRKTPLKYQEEIRKQALKYTSSDDEC